MATSTWLGIAPAVAQVDIITVSGTWGAGDTVGITIGDKTLTITIGTLVTTAQVATTIKQAWENETFTDTTATVSHVDGGQAFEEFKEMTATVSSSVVSITHDTDGVPFVMAVGQTTAGDGLATETTPTAASGPNFANDATNWNGVVPTATTDVVLEDSSVSILYGLDGFAGTLNSFIQYASYTGQVGLPETNSNGYPEYRQTYLDVDCDVATNPVVLGRGEGNGSSLTKINSGSLKTLLEIDSTGNSTDDFGAVIWKGTHVDNAITVRSGSLSVGPFLRTAGVDASNLKTLRITGGSVFLSRHTTLTAANSISVQGGSLDTDAIGADIVTLTVDTGSVKTTDNITTLTVSDGTVQIGGSATVVTMNINGGTVDYRSTGTITTANIDGTLDFSNDNRLRIITTCNLKKNGTIEDPLTTATFTIVRDAQVRRITAE